MNNKGKDFSRVGIQYTYFSEISIDETTLKTPPLI